MSTPEPFDPEAAVRGFTATWKRVVTDSRAFFAEMPETGGLRDPLVFLAICAGIDALGSLLVTFSVAALLSTFVMQLASALLLAAVLVLVAQHLFDGRAGFEPVFRVVAYAAAPTVFAWLPRVGILAVLYACYLVLRGVERVQGFDTTRAVLTVLIAVVVDLLVLGALAGGYLLAG